MDASDSAYTTSIRQHRENVARAQFEYMAREFFKKWQPEDPQQAHNFSAELFMLVRQIQTDSIKPLLDHITATYQLNHMAVEAAKLKIG